MQLSFPYELAGIRLLEAVAEEHGEIFTSAEAAQVASRLGLSRVHTRKLVSRLASGGYLRRLRNRLYAVGPRFGSPGVPHAFAVATHLVQPSAISHWSALHHWGLVDQVPLVVSASTPKSVTPPELRDGRRERMMKQGHSAWVIDGVRYEYIRIPEQDMFGIRDVWVDDRTQVPMFDAERALLDAFVHLRGFGQSGLGMQILTERGDQVDFEKLMEYARRMGRPAVLQRLESAIARTRLRDIAQAAT